MHEGMRPALPERDASQLQAHEFETVSDEVIKTLDGDSMMFCLGTGKTGTKTLKDVFGNRHARSVKRGHLCASGYANGISSTLPPCDAGLLFEPK